MKMNSNASNMKVSFDEPENVWRKVWSRANFIQHNPTWFLSSFLFFSKFLMLDEMLDAFAPNFIRHLGCQKCGTNLSAYWDVGQFPCQTAQMSNFWDAHLSDILEVWNFWTNALLDKWDFAHLTWAHYWLLVNFQSDSCNFLNYQNYLMMKERPFYYYQNFCLYVIVKD